MTDDDSAPQIGAFTWAAARRLASVDVDPTTSHQHELGGAARLRRHLVGSRRLDGLETSANLETMWLGLTDDDDPVDAHENVTLYDARRRVSHRGPEWRLYYRAGGQAEELLSQHAPGDLIVYATPATSSPDLVVITAPAGSQWKRTLLTIFPMDRDPGRQLRLVPTLALEAAQSRPIARLIAERLGVGLHEPSDVAWLEQRLGALLVSVDFPDTQTMAILARERLGPWTTGTPDQRLVDLLDTETRLFYALEDAQALPRFENECSTTDDYLELAKSLLQRRRSRRGYSFELHLESMFREAGLRFETQVQTEPGTRVDFIFPGLSVYLSGETSLDDRVVHMNAKTTARERWKQVMKEAVRLRRRHLGTLDPNVSAATIADATRSGVRLVLPEPMVEVYPADIRDELWTFTDFMEHVAGTQGALRTYH